MKLFDRFSAHPHQYIIPWEQVSSVILGEYGVFLFFCFDRKILCLCLIKTENPAQNTNFERRCKDAENDFKRHPDGALPDGWQNLRMFY